MTRPEPEVVTYGPDEFDREFGDEDADARLVPAGARGVRALLRSVEAPAQPSPPAYLRGDRLERDGANFIDATLYLLDWLEVPPDVRDVVVAIAGLSGGDYLGFSELPRTQIAERLGLSVESVRTRLEALWDWQRAHQRTLVQIDEQEYDHKRKRYTTTRYRPVIVRAAAELIRALRERGARPTTAARADSPFLDAAASAIAERVADELPGVNLSRRRKARADRAPAARRRDDLEARRERALALVVEWCAALVAAGYDWRDELDAFFVSAAERATAATNNQIQGIGQNDL